MTNYAYLRVSTNAQDVENQKLGVLEYCARKHISPLQIIEDTVSSKKSWKQRALGKIISQADIGDLLVVAEVSRLARSTLEVLELLQTAAQKQMIVHIAKNSLIMDGSLQAHITATIFGLAAQIERDFISSRTREALALRKSKGLKVGRPLGPSPHLKLDQNRDLIISYLKKGVSKRSIAKIVECCPSTLYDWIKRRKFT